MIPNVVGEIPLDDPPNSRCHFRKVVGEEGSECSYETDTLDSALVVPVETRHGVLRFEDLVGSVPATSLVQNVRTSFAAACSDRYSFGAVAMSRM